MRKPKVQFISFRYGHDGPTKFTGWVVSTDDTAEVHTEDDVLRLVLTRCGPKSVVLHTVTSCAGDTDSYVQDFSTKIRLRVSNSHAVRAKEHNDALDAVLRSGLRTLRVCEDSLEAMLRAVRRSAFYRANSLT